MAALEDNLHWVIIAVVVLAVFLYAVIVFITIMRRKLRVRDASREIALLKMDLLSKQAHLENLIEDSVQWSPRDLKKYNKCCACLCYRFCPLLTKKFCRKIEWDQKLFPNGYVSQDTRICTEGD